MTSWPTLYMWPTLSEIPLFCPWFCPTGHLQIKNHRQFSRPLALIQLQQRTDNQRSLADVTSFHREIPWNISLLLDLWISSFNPHTTWYVWFMKSSHFFFEPPRVTIFPPTLEAMKTCMFYRKMVLKHSVPPVFPGHGHDRTFDMSLLSTNQSQTSTSPSFNG